MKVLVTGGAGYVGTVLARRLVELGHAVRVVDIGFFGLDHVDQRVELVAGDILEFDSAWLEGVDAVVHLAGLSNDPMAAFSPRLNYMLNAAGAAIVAEASKRAGVHRFVLGSTCSVYGLDDARPLDEDHPTSPSFPYAISKLMAERMLGCLTDDAFRPIILRKGTVVGWSPRMRFDLVVNTMIKTALLERTITIHNPDLWRPLIDVEDAAMAYVYAVEAPPSVVGVFNISGANFKLDELGSIVAAGLRDRGIEVELRSEDRQDVRSYRVETSKAARVLGFTARKPMTQTVTEVIERARAMPRRDLEHRRHYNIRQFEHLMANGSVPALAASVQSGQALAAGRAH